MRRARDGRTWRIGTDADVAWIAEGISMGRTVTAAIPPMFEAYATVVVEYGEGRVKHDRAVLALLAEQSPDQRWWLGYLDTGVDDIVFPDVPKVTLYAGWHYVLVAAGPEQAAAWRPSDGRAFGTGDLPNLMFPADQSWLVSTLWDDTGPASADRPLSRTGSCATLICGPGRWRLGRTPRHQVMRCCDPGLGRLVSRSCAVQRVCLNAGGSEAGLTSLPALTFAAPGVARASTCPIVASDQMGRGSP